MLTACEFSLGPLDGGRISTQYFHYCCSCCCSVLNPHATCCCRQQRVFYTLRVISWFRVYGSVASGHKAECHAGLYGLSAQGLHSFQALGFGVSQSFQGTAQASPALRATTNRQWSQDSNHSCRHPREFSWHQTQQSYPTCPECLLRKN